MNAAVDDELSLFLTNTHYTPNAFERSWQEHQQVVDAIRNGDPEAAAGAFESHVLKGKQTPRGRTGHDPLLTQIIKTARFQQGTTMKYLARTLAFALFACFTATAARAELLDDIKARGTLTCGVLGNLEPFGYQGPDDPRAGRL